LEHFIADEADREVVEELLRQHSHSQSNDEQEGDLNPGGHETMIVDFSVLLWLPEKAAFQQIEPDDAEELSFHILKGLRSAPAHWEAEKKVIAVIRQFGLPTFLIALSAAESKWNELLVILSLLLASRDITEEEAAALSSAEKAG